MAVQKCLICRHAKGDRCEYFNTQQQEIQDDSRALGCGIQSFDARWEVTAKTRKEKQTLNSKREIALQKKSLSCEVNSR